MPSPESIHIRSTFATRSEPVTTPIEVQRQEWEQAVAQAAGVDVTLDVWPDMWHVWHGWAASLPEGQQALDKIGIYLRKHNLTRTQEDANGEHKQFR